MLCSKLAPLEARDLGTLDSGMDMLSQHINVYMPLALQY